MWSCRTSSELSLTEIAFSWEWYWCSGLPHSVIQVQLSFQLAICYWVSGSYRWTNYMNGQLQAKVRCWYKQNGCSHITTCVKIHICSKLQSIDHFKGMQLVVWQWRKVATAPLLLLTIARNGQYIATHQSHMKKFFFSYMTAQCSYYTRIE